MTCVVGDVHGCLKTLKALIKKLPKGEQIVFTGDLIDRGPKSKQVVQYVIDKGYLCVKGNHEDMCLYYPNDWGRNGAAETLKSYGLKYSVRFSDPCMLDHDESQNPEKLAKFREHQDWMINLPVYLLFDDVMNELGEKLLVTHSSAAKVWDWPEDRKKEQSFNFEEHLLWNRNHDPDPIPGIFNVIGHTPLEEPTFRKRMAFIDTGAVYKNKLTALRFPSMEIFQQDYID